MSPAIPEAVALQPCRGQRDLWLRARCPGLPHPASSGQAHAWHGAAGCSAHHALGYVCPSTGCVCAGVGCVCPSITLRHRSTPPRIPPRCLTPLRAASHACVAAASHMWMLLRVCHAGAVLTVPGTAPLSPAPHRRDPGWNRRCEKAPGCVSWEPWSRCWGGWAMWPEPKGCRLFSSSLVRDLPHERRNLMPRVGARSLPPGEGFATGHAKGARGAGLLSLPSLGEPPRCLTLVGFALV